MRDKVQDLQALVIREFNLLPSTPIDVWKVAADWVEDRGDPFLAHLLREGRLTFPEQYTKYDRNILVLDSPCIEDNDGWCPGSDPAAVCIDHDGYGDGSGFACGDGIGPEWMRERFCYCDRVDPGSGSAHGAGRGDGTGENNHYSWIDEAVSP